jgi:DUF4097 and DUF4098 domain-containing protein YvlB
MKKFLEDLRKELELKNMSKKEIDDIIGDHEEMIHQALEDGVSEEDLKSRFGSPKDLADELASDEVDNQEEKLEKKPMDKNISFQVNNKSISITVDLVSDDVSIELSNDAELHVRSNKVIKEDKYEVSFKDNLLSIIAKDKKKSGTFSFSSNSTQNFEIFVPKNTVIDVITCNTVNGDIDLEKLSTKKTKLNIVNGDIELKSFNSNYLIVSLVSGDMKMSHAEIQNDFILHTVSGDSKIDDVTCNMLELHTVSGDIDGYELYPNSVKLQSVSGDINIENKNFKDIEVVSKSTLSGSINIKNKA